MQTTKFQTVDEYMSAFSSKTKEFLKNMRAAIKKAAPDAEEVISYNIPAFKLRGMLVWYAGYKEHIGFYPRSSVIDLFKKELEGYKLSKGTIQFPLDQPLPVELITRIVKLRVRENNEAETTKVKARAAIKEKAKASVEAKTKTVAPVKVKAKVPAKVKVKVPAKVKKSAKANR